MIRRARLSRVDGVGTSGIAMGFIERLTADLITLGGSLRALRYTTHIAKNPTRVFPQLIEELAEKYGDAPALLSDRENFSYRELGARSNRYARWALGAGRRQGRHGLPADAEPAGIPGDLARHHPRRRRGGAAQHQPDRPGARPLHQRGRAEAHHRRRRDAAGAAIGAAAPHVERQRSGCTATPPPTCRASTARSRPAPANALADGERRALTIEDRALFIYTSGTTGLPKAANINHYRLMLATHAFAAVMNTRASDRMYDCLPLYHTAGGVLATGALLLKGGSVVIRERFSAREFWDDVVRCECTLLQYIGEFCRYLVNSPPHPKEREHKLRLACGNGLRPDVWAEFKQRFRIPQIIEFYAATEGNVTHLQLRRQGRRGRPRALVPRASFPDQGRALRRRAASSRCAPPTASASNASPTSPAR